MYQDGSGCVRMCEDVSGCVRIESKENKQHCKEHREHREDREVLNQVSLIMVCLKFNSL